MRVDIWSDVVCPWCYVGKARFDKALSGFARGGEVEVVFRSFELDPAAERAPRQTNLQMISEKFGLPRAQALQMEERVAGLARAEGLRYQLERPNGNTFDLHRVLHLGRDRGVQEAVADALYTANFADARAIFDPDVVTEVATGAGLDAAEVRKVLAGDEYAGAVRADEEQARALGATGVPFFVFDMRIGVSGAQATETFSQALAQAWEQASA
ncbi:MAG TPA: DsbA family oxidoreductase [Trebonia sp.]|jgi:predicted DsbA family dithiol-disulfide isomerase|nr:DsbA family oxidoreductase [Trebonia sp.]